MTLYRGFNKLIKNTTLENPFLKTPRTPLHTANEVHSIADDWFEENLSVRARSQCVFCTQNIHLAQSYSLGFQSGSVAEIIPIGDYSLIYSNKVIDLNNHSHDFDHTPSQIRSWLREQNYLSINDISDLPKEFEGEIMLYCKSYQVIVKNSYSN